MSDGYEGGPRDSPGLPETQLPHQGSGSGPYNTEVWPSREGGGYGVNDLGRCTQAHTAPSLWREPLEAGEEGREAGGGCESSCEVLRKKTWKLWLTSSLTRTHG